MSNNKIPIILIVLILSFSVLYITGCSEEVVEADFVSEQVELLLSPAAQANEVIYYIDFINVTEDMLSIQGWGLLSDHDTEGIEHYLLLFSGDDVDIYNTQNLETEDLPSILAGSDDYDVSNAGFIANVPVDLLHNGFYTVGLYVKTDEAEGYVATERYLYSKKEYQSTRAEVVDEVIDDENNIIFNLDSLAVEGDFINIRGWAFIEDKDTYFIEHYLVLKQDNDAEYYATDQEEREDVTAHFEDLELNLDHAGFSVKIPRQVLNDGMYEIGLYIAVGSRNEQVMTGRTIRQRELFISMQQDLSFEEDDISKDVWQNIDSVVIDDSYLTVRGWTFFWEEDASDTDKYLLLKKDDQVMVFDVETVIRQDVTDHFKAFFDNNLDHAGFYAKIPLEELGEGEYTIGIYIETPEKKARIYTYEKVEVE